MASKESQSTEEKLFSPLLRKIQGLGPSFTSMVQNVKDSLIGATSALQYAKRREQKVWDDVAETIIKIDDLIENYKIRAPQLAIHKDQLTEIIEEGVENIKKDMAICLEEPKTEEKPTLLKEHPDGKQDSAQPDLWLSEATKNLEGENSTDVHLRYNRLPPILQHRLLFFSVFPENAIIKKKPMIYWWIAEGLLKPTENKTAEQIGEECLSMLILSGLIIPVSKKHDKAARCCKLHFGVREMLISRLIEARLFEFYPQERLTSGECPISCMIATDSEQSIAASLDSKSDDLRSLFNVTTQYLICDHVKFSRLKSIVALQLGRWQASATHHIEIEDPKFLESLKSMKDLKYLSLQGISNIAALPDSLKLLTNLQILDLRACHNLEALPAAVVSLMNLTHLDVSGCCLLDRMPKGLGSLSELQVLKGFIISSRTIRDSGHLKELGALKKLRKLSINIASEAEANVHLKELSSFSSLCSLTITWGRITTRLKEPSTEISLPNLEKLDLQCTQHEELEWLKPAKFRNLKKLYIRGGRIKHLNLGTDAERWNVETLRLKYLHELEGMERNRWRELKNAFPSRDCIEIYKCPKLYKDRIWKKNEEASTSAISTSSSSSSGEGHMNSPLALQPS